MEQDIIVLGAGMVGTCTALELALRGHRVTLVDRRPPGQETSYGNAGVIQREAVEPYAMPRDLRYLVSAALGRRTDIRYHLGGLLAALPPLLRYWHASAPARHREISRAYASLIAHATGEHARYIDLAGAGGLVRHGGIRMLYRSDAAFARALADARRVADGYGIGFDALDADAIAAAEPALAMRLPGAIHWTDAWSAIDPGELVAAYARAYVAHGGQLVQAGIRDLRPQAAGWRIDTDAGALEAAQVVLALGPWAATWTRRLGYRLPLFVKRGYHRHYTGGATLSVPTLDAERGYVLAPQRRGLRLTTGAEIARIDAVPTPVQLARVEAEARGLLELGSAVEAEPWFGSRPCCADMKPVIGPAMRHRGLWFNVGHGHQGFTLGPASARLLADLLEQRTPFVDPLPFLPARFG